MCHIVGGEDNFRGYGRARTGHPIGVGALESVVESRFSRHCGQAPPGPFPAVGPCSGGGVSVANAAFLENFLRRGVRDSGGFETL